MPDKIAEAIPFVKTFFMFLASASLASLGNFIHEYEVMIGAVSTLLQWLAWGGASAVASVTVIKFLQDNGFVPKRKKK